MRGTVLPLSLLIMAQSPPPPMPQLCIPNATAQALDAYLQQAAIVRAQLIEGVQAELRLADAVKKAKTDQRAEDTQQSAAPK
jgi:hypothetical protein